jgi:hypothetical protein
MLLVLAGSRTKQYLGTVLLFYFLAQGGQGPQGPSFFFSIFFYFFIFLFLKQMKEDFHCRESNNNNAPASFGQGGKWKTDRA